MKITFFIGGLSGGGAERVTCNLASYLAKRGHKINVLTMSDDKPSYTIDDRVTRTSLLFAYERKNFIYNSALRLCRFISHLWKNQVDVYVVMLPVTTIMLLLMRFKTKAKVIASERVAPAMYPIMQQKLLKLLARKADGWVFQTREVRSWYEGYTRIAKVSIIPNAINSDFIKEPYHGERKKTIVTAGRLTEQKNHLLLINAFAKICQNFPDYQLIIYGEGEIKEKLEYTAKELGLKDKVFLPGYTTNIGDITNIKYANIS